MLHTGNRLIPVLHIVHLLIAISGAVFICLVAVSRDVYSGWFTAVFAAAIFSLNFLSRERAIPFLLLIASLCGWMITGISGTDVQIVTALILSYIAGFSAEALFRRRAIALTRGHCYLFLFSTLVLLSGAVTWIKLNTFSVVPALGYKNVAVNVWGTSSDALMLYSTFFTLGYFAWSGIFLASANRDCTDRFRTLLRDVIFIVVLVNFVAVAVQYFIIPDSFAPDGRLSDGRANGLMSFCNALGNTSSLIIAFAPLWWRKKPREWMSWAIVALSAMNLYFSGSRAGMGFVLLWAVVAGVYSLFRRKTAGRFRLKKVLVIGFVSICMFIAVMGVEYFVYDRTPMIVQRSMQLAENFNIDYFIFLRSGMWGFASYLFCANPLGGIGSGTYFSELGNFSSILGTRSWFVDNALNFYLHIAAETGIITLVLILMVLAWLIRRSLFTKEGNNSKPMAYGGLALVCYLPALLFGPHLNDPETMLYFWVFAGLLAAGSPGRPEPSPQYRPGFRSMLIAGATIVITVSAFIWGAIEYHPNKMWNKLRWHVQAGVYPKEGEPVVVRWTKPEAIVALRRSGRLLHLKWRAGDINLPDNSRAIRFYLVDRLIDDVTIEDTDWHESYYWTGEYKHRFTALGIKVDPGFIPDEVLHNGDKRNLGLCLQTAEFVNVMKEPMLGVYEPERSGESNFRWTNRISYYRIPRDIVAVRFKASSSHTRLAEEPVVLDATFNGRPAGSFTFSDSQWRDIEIRLGDLPAGEVLRGKYPGMLVLTCSRAFVPAEEVPDSRDFRRLGLAIRGLRMDRSVKPPVEGP